MFELDLYHLKHLMFEHWRPLEFGVEKPTDTFFSLRFFPLPHPPKKKISFSTVLDLPLKLLCCLNVSDC